MSGNVHWNLEMAVKDGQLDAFKALMAEMVAATQANEPGTMNYEWFLSEDGRTCHIYERYQDSAATLVHLGSFGKLYAERFMAAATPTRFSLYGAPSDEVKQALAPIGAVHFGQIGGFAR